MRTYLEHFFFCRQLFFSRAYSKQRVERHPSYFSEGQNELFSSQLFQISVLSILFYPLQRMQLALRHFNRQKLIKQQKCSFDTPNCFDDFPISEKLAKLGESRALLTILFRPNRSHVFHPKNYLGTAARERRRQGEGGVTGLSWKMIR
jgi:hypothetical protein